MEGHTIDCKKCGGILDVPEGLNSVFCAYCGTKNLVTDILEIPGVTLLCLKCNTKNKDENIYCDKCGTMLQYYCQFCSELHSFNKKVCPKEGLKFNVNTTIDKDGKTALYKAVELGHVDTVKSLIALGADVNIRHKNGYTLLHSAIQYGDIEIVKLLITHGAETNEFSQRIEQAIEKWNKALKTIEEAIKLSKCKISLPQQYTVDELIKTCKLIDDTFYTNFIEIERKAMKACNELFNISKERLNIEIENNYETLGLLNKKIEQEKEDCKNAITTNKTALKNLEEKYTNNSTISEDKYKLKIFLAMIGLTIVVASIYNGSTFYDTFLLRLDFLGIFIIFAILGFFLVIFPIRSILSSRKALNGEKENFNLMKLEFKNKLEERKKENSNRLSLLENQLQETNYKIEQIKKALKLFNL